MAANLAGMMQQLNQSITGSNAVDNIGGLLDQVSQSAGGMMGSALGQDSMSFMNQGAKNLEVANRVGGLDLSTAEGLKQASEAYGAAGQQQQQMALAEAARKRQMEQAARESLTLRAKKLGLDGIAEGLIAGGPVGEAQQAVQTMEMQQLIAGKGEAARKGMAKAAGIPESQFNELGLANITDEQFQNVLTGQKGETKAYVDGTGKPVMLRTSDYGTVWDKNQNKFVNPSELNLTPAPNVQKVTNVSNKMVEALALKGVDNFNDLYAAADEAQANIENIDRNLELIDNMPTGMGANIELFARRFANVLSDNPDASVANAEVYLAEAAQRVAKEIKAFGSGTGLSDKDREFTEKMVAGQLPLDAESMRRILRIRRDVSAKTLEKFHDIKGKVSKQIDDPAVMSMYTLKPPSTVQPGAPERNVIGVYNPATGLIE